MENELNAAPEMGIMYERCLNCAKLLDHKCNGPNFMSMPVADMIEWCNRFRDKQKHKLTYDRIADLTALSKSTVYSFFTASHDDYRIGTIQPIITALIGAWSDNPCGDPTDDERTNYEMRLKTFQKEIIMYEDAVRRYEKMNVTNETQQMFLNEQIEALQKLVQQQNTKTKKWKRITVYLSISLLLVFLLVAAAVVVDLLDPNVGYINLIDTFTK